jgi:Holliday junction DNA helicase RuvA
LISFLEGEVVEKAGDRVVLAVGGTGYEVLVPVSAIARLPAVGRVARVFTRLHVREDAMVLFGFASVAEREVFDLLITVSGVGPKLAQAFLSVLPPEAIRRAVATNDVAALATVPGVGKKMAGRVAMELRDRLGAGDVVAVGPVSEVREALLALGLTPQEASDAVARVVPDEDRPVEELLKEALLTVAGGSGGSRVRPGA